MSVGASRLRRWPLSILTALDRLGNAILLGDDRQTLSGRAYFARQDGKWWGGVATAFDWLALHVFGQADHCLRSAEFDAALRDVTSRTP